MRYYTETDACQLTSTASIQIETAFICSLSSKVKQSEGQFEGCSKPLGRLSNIYRTSGTNVNQAEANLA
jgi:hypothetical protein